MLGADAAIAALLFIVAGQFRFGDGQWPTLWAALGVDVRFGAIFHAAAWCTILWFLGLYAFRVRWTLASELEDILTASFILTFGTMSFLYLVRLVDVSRSFLFILLVAQPIATMAGRIVLRLFFGWLRKRGYNRTFMVVVGVGDEAQAFADSVERHKDLGIEVIGHLRGPGGGDGVVTRPILGDGDDLARIFREQIVDEVAICVPAGAADWIEPLIRLSADEGKHVRVPTVTPARTLDLQTEEMDGMVIRSYIHGPTRMFSLLLKRIMDIVGAVVGLVILSPVLLAVAIAIALKEGRPVLFHQTRIGLQGRAFTLYKFRTMVHDAEERFGEVVGHSDTQGAAFKMVDDPRVTPLGAFLRRTSLDELPQLWNVLRGDMSLIGPRPAPPREVVEYDVWHRRRLSMRPGITGLWQVGARLDKHFDARAQLDLEYIDSWSLGLDLRILARTVPAVVGRTGT